MRIHQITPKTAREHMFSSNIYRVRVDHTNNTMYYVPIRSMSASNIEQAEKDVNCFFVEIDWKGEFDYEKTNNSVTKHHIDNLGPWECPGQREMDLSGSL